MEKKKLSPKELFSIIAVVILAFGLTVAGVVYLTGFLISDKPTVPLTKLEVKDENNTIIMSNDQQTIHEVAVNNNDNIPHSNASAENKTSTTNIEANVAPQNNPQNTAEKPQVQKPPQNNNTQTNESKKINYQLQLFAFQTESKAKEEVKKYKPIYPDIFILKVDLGDNGIWYRVRCCGTDTKEKATALKNEIQSKYKIIPDIVQPQK